MVFGLEGFGEELERVVVGYGGLFECCCVGWDWVLFGKFFVIVGLYFVLMCGCLFVYVFWFGFCMFWVRWLLFLLGEVMK